MTGSPDSPSDVAPPTATPPFKSPQDPSNGSSVPTCCTRPPCSIGWPKVMLPSPSKTWNTCGRLHGPIWDPSNSNGRNARYGRTKHDRMFTINLVDMAFHLAWPVSFVVMLTFSIHREYLLMGLSGVSAIHGLGTVLVLKRWPCLVLWPYLVALDVMYRALVIQGYRRAVQAPYSKGNWVSPERVVTDLTPPANGVLTSSRPQ